MPEIKDDIGFAGIGKRIEDIEEPRLQASTAEPSSQEQTQEEPVENVHEAADEEIKSGKVVYKNKGVPKFVWVIGIICVIILFSVFSENSSSKRSPSSSTPYSPPRSSGSFQLPTPSYAPQNQTDSSYSDDVSGNGTFRCTSYHHNSANALLPTSYEKSQIESEKTILQIDERELEQLRNDIDSTIIDRSSQYSIDQYNMTINEYNSKLEDYKLRARLYKGKISTYNAKIDSYNTYLQANCRKVN